MRKALYHISYTLIIYNPSLPATFTQSNNNNVANQVKTCHFYVSSRLSAAKVHISSESTKQIVTFFVKKATMKHFLPPFIQRMHPVCEVHSLFNDAAARMATALVVDASTYDVKQFASDGLLTRLIVL